MQQQQRQQPSSLVSLISSLRSSVLVRVPEVTLDTFSVRFWACSSFRALLFWCREVLLVLFCQQQQQRQQRQQPSSISHQFPQVFSSSRVSEVTLGTFSVRFCGVFVLPCLAVLVPGAALATLLSAAEAAAARQGPFWCREVLLGSSNSSSSSGNGSSRLVSLINSLSSVPLRLQF